MEATIEFEIPGDAIPQPRARATRMGRMYTPTKNGIAVFKNAIAYAAKLRAARAGWPTPAKGDESAFRVDVLAIFARPPSHLTRSGAVRAGAPRFPGLRCGDNDNIEKGIWDAITKSGAVWLDDTQVVENMTAKRYAEPGEPARTVVQVRRLPP